MTKIEVYYLIDLFVFLQLALVLTYQQHISRFMWEWEMDPHRRPYIIWSGFYGVYHIGHITLDWELITSLVERWCPKTHISPTYWDLDHYFTRCFYHVTPQNLLQGHDSHFTPQAQRLKVETTQTSSCNWKFPITKFLFRVVK